MLVRKLLSWFMNWIAFLILAHGLGANAFGLVSSKAYSAAILSINFDLYQVKVPKQLTQKYDINEKICLV